MLSEATSQISSRTGTSLISRSDGNDNSVSAPGLVYLFSLHYDHSFWMSTVYTVIEIIQLYAFVMNSHLPSHVLLSTILSYSQVPFWDGTLYGGFVTYTMYQGLYYTFVGIVLFIWFVSLLSIFYDNTLLRWFVRVFFRHLVHVCISVLAIPIMLTLLVGVVCQETTSQSNSVRQYPESHEYSIKQHVLFFSSVSCTGHAILLKRVISIVVGIMWLVASYIFYFTLYSADIDSTSVRRHLNYHLEQFLFIYRNFLVFMFVLTQAYDELAVYTIVVAAVSFMGCVFFCVFLPFYIIAMNRLYAIVLALIGWTAIIVLTSMQVENEIFLNQNYYYLTLIVGSAIVVAVVYACSFIRLNKNTAYMLRHCNDENFVRLTHNIFATAALQTDEELIPFPRRLPRTDQIFSPYYSTSLAILRDKLIEEAEQGVSDLVEGGGGGDDDGGNVKNETSYGTSYVKSSGIGQYPMPGEHISEDTNSAVIDHDDYNGYGGIRVGGRKVLSITDNLVEQSTRRQVVSPTLNAICLATDVGVSTRFMHEWKERTRTLPTPYMIYFASRIYNRSMLKFPSSTLLRISYVQFLCDYAPNYTRLMLSLDILSKCKRELHVNLTEAFFCHFHTNHIKDLLGMRNATYTVMHRRVRNAHESVLVSAACVWRCLVDRYNARCVDEDTESGSSHKHNTSHDTHAGGRSSSRRHHRHHRQSSSQGQRVDGRREGNMSGQESGGTGTNRQDGKEERVAGSGGNGRGVRQDRSDEEDLSVLYWHCCTLARRRHTCFMLYKDAVHMMTDDARILRNLASFMSDVYSFMQSSKLCRRAADVVARMQADRLRLAFNDAGTDVDLAASGNWTGVDREMGGGKNAANTQRRSTPESSASHAVGMAKKAAALASFSFSQASHNNNANNIAKSTDDAGGGGSLNASSVEGEDSLKLSSSSALDDRSNSINSSLSSSTIIDSLISTSASCSSTSVIGSSQSRLRQTKKVSGRIARSILESIASNYSVVRSRLKGSLLSKVDALCSLVMCALVVVNYVVVSNTFTQCYRSTLMLYDLGATQTLCNLLLAQIQRTASLLPIDAEVGLTEEATKNLQGNITYSMALKTAVDSSHRNTLFRDNHLTDESMRSILSQLNTYTSYLTSEIYAVELPTSYITHIEITLSTVSHIIQKLSNVPNVTAFQQDPQMRMLNEVWLYELNSTFTDITARISAMIRYSFDVNMITIVTCLMACVTMLCVTMYVIFWNYRRHARAVNRELSLFDIIPGDSVRKLEVEAQSRLDLFRYLNNMDHACTPTPGGDALETNEGHYTGVSHTDHNNHAADNNYASNTTPRYNATATELPATKRATSVNDPGEQRSPGDRGGTSLTHGIMSSGVTPTMARTHRDKHSDAAAAAATATAPIQSAETSGGDHSLLSGASAWLSHESPPDAADRPLALNTPHPESAANTAVSGGETAENTEESSSDDASSEERREAAVEARKLHLLNVFHARTDKRRRCGSRRRKEEEAKRRRDGEPHSLSYREEEDDSNDSDRSSNINSDRVGEISSSDSDSETDYRTSKSCGATGQHANEDGVDARVRSCRSRHNTKSGEGGAQGGGLAALDGAATAPRYRNLGRDMYLVALGLLFGIVALVPSLFLYMKNDLIRLNINEKNEQVSCIAHSINNAFSMVLLSSLFVVGGAYESFNPAADSIKNTMISVSRCIAQSDKSNFTTLVNSVVKNTMISMRLLVQTAMAAGDDGNQNNNNDDDAWIGQSRAEWAAVDEAASTLAELAYAMLANFTWEALPVTANMMHMLEDNLTLDELMSWTPYTNFTHDTALPATDRASLALNTFFGPMGIALMERLHMESKSLICSVAKNQVQVIAENMRSGWLFSTLTFAFTAVAALLTLATLLLGNSQPMVRYIQCLLLLLLCAVLTMNVLISQTTESYISQLSEAVDVFRDTQIRSWSFFRVSALLLAYPFYSNDRYLRDILEFTQESNLQSFEADFLQSPSNSISTTLLSHYTTLLERQFALLDYTWPALVTTIRAHKNVSLYTNDPRLAHATWNMSRDPFYQNFSTLYPNEAHFTTYVADVTESTTEAMQQLAQGTTSSTLVRNLTLAIIDAESATRDAIQQQYTSYAAATFERRTRYMIVAVALSATTCLVSALGMIYFAQLTLHGFTVERADVAIYRLVFESKTRLVLGMYGMIVLLLVLSDLVCIVTLYTLKDRSATVIVTQRAQWFLTYIYALAESMRAPHNFGMYLVSRQTLSSALDHANMLYRNAYLYPDMSRWLHTSSSEWNASANDDQQDTIVQMLGIAVCQNPASAHGNQALPWVQLFSILDTVQNIVDLGSESSMQSTPVVNLIRQLENQMGSILFSLLSYMQQTTSDVRESLSPYNMVCYVALGLAVMLMVALYFFVLRRHESQLRQLSVGMQLQLLGLPTDVLNTVPEVQEFYNPESGSTNDQIKRKLQQSEKLLQNILPPSISRRLKNGERVIADFHPSVTAAFANLVGFDQYSSRLDLQQIVIFLNGIVVAFDYIVDMLDLEKVKTVGDIYFFCGGLIKATARDHALRCMECSLYFYEALEVHNSRHGTPNIKLRVGLNTDTAVAGVIGNKKVAYDLWGDCVNTASRMYSTSMPGHIQVTQATYDHVKSYFRFEDRWVQAKGKGALLTHVYVDRIKPSAYSDLNWRVSS